MKQEADSKDRQEAAVHSAASQSLADASSKFFAGQAAAMTMMTAFGMNLTAQMAGAFMGAFANALDQGEAIKPAPEAAVTPETNKERAGTAKVVPLRVVKKDRAPVADDLKKISGIGPRLEKVLNGMGIKSFAEIAKWTEAEMLEIDDKLGLENRIIRDDWASQAKALLEG